MIKKQKRAEMIIIKKYVCKWMTRRAYLKLSSATTFIQCCWRHVQARKELLRIQQEAKELSIIPIGNSMMNHLKDRGNDTIQEMSYSSFGVKFSII